MSENREKVNALEASLPQGGQLAPSLGKEGQQAPSLGRGQLALAGPFSAPCLSQKRALLSLHLHQVCSSRVCTYMFFQSDL